MSVFASQVSLLLGIRNSAWDCIHPNSYDPQNYDTSLTQEESEVRKGNSSSTVVKLQLTHPPSGIWTIIFTILCINPSLMAQSLLTKPLFFIIKIRQEQDLYSICLMVGPALAEDFSTRSGFQWLVGPFQKSSFLLASNREQCRLSLGFKKDPNSLSCTGQWCIYEWSRGSMVNRNEHWVRSQQLEP